MRKMKKLAALILAGAMVLGMSTTAFADGETTKPLASDDVTASVENVEPGAVVKAYQIIEGDYGTNGFLGYKEVTPTAGMLVDIIDGTYLDKEDDIPTAEDVIAIAEGINDDELVLANVVTFAAGATDEETGLATYTGDLTAGYWVVLVRGTTNVYNPMLIGVYYDADTETDGIQGSGDNNILVPDPSVDATTSWTLKATDAYAKSSAPTIVKTADVSTQEAGGTVNFDIETTIPDYSSEYIDDDAATTDVVFKIKDTLTNLTLDLDEDDVNKGIKVTVDDTDIKATEDGVVNFTFTEGTPTTASFEINFSQDFILAHGGDSVLVEYSATVTENAINTIAGENKAELRYTRNPGDNGGYDYDIEKVYSFDIDGATTEQIITKVKKVEAEGTETEETTAPLAGATFVLYTDEACTTPYTNTSGIDGLNEYGEVVSDEDGQLHISGLDVGTYYIKETKAPTGYSLNDTIYKIVITAEIDGEELVSWEVVVTDLATNTVKENSFTVNHEVEDGFDKEINETPVMNIKLIALPSTGGIGTTIFTVGGVAIILAAAAMLFARRRVAR